MKRKTVTNNLLALIITCMMAISSVYILPTTMIVNAENLEQSEKISADNEGFATSSDAEDDEFLEEKPEEAEEHNKSDVTEEKMSDEQIEITSEEQENEKISANVETGKCGENVTYSLDKSTGKLTVSGSGYMYDYDYGKSPFFEREDITEVIISKGVTSIGQRAFFSCDGLKSATIPGSVISIEYAAFEHCHNLKSVTISDGVKVIGEGAFSYCNSLTNITIPDSVTSIDRYAFMYCDMTSITIPDSITRIREEVFWGCYSLTSITIPNSVTSIDDNAFTYCTSLTSIIIPGSVTSIGQRAFWGCRRLKSVTIRNGVKVIGEDAFNDCSSLTSITIPNSVTVIKDDHIEGDYYVFDNENLVINIECSEYLCSYVAWGKYKKLVVKHVDERNPTITKATLTTNGTLKAHCYNCNQDVKRTIYYPKTFALSTKSYVCNGSIHKPKVTVTDCKGNVIEAKNNYTVTYLDSNGKVVEPKEVGTYIAKITMKGNYSGTKKLSYTIVPTKTTIGTLAIAADGITVKWTKNTSGKGYIIYRSVNGAAYEKIKTIADNKIVSWKDTGAKTNGYKYQYKIVSYKVVDGVTYKSDYSPIKTRYFVSQPAVSSLTSGSAGKMTLKWGKNSKATGYQIQYSTDSTFATYKTSNVTSNTTVSRNFSNLTKGKKYYVRIRSYKTVGSTKYYSAWSSKKSVTISK